MMPRAFSLIIFVSFFFLLRVEAQTNFVLHSFGRSTFFGGVNGYYTNSDGIDPNGWLTLSGGAMYGTATYGGTKGSGTIFALGTNGSFTVLYSFPTNDVGVGNSLGANPNGSLVFSNGLLFGTTSAGGTNDQGVIFSVGTNGLNFKALHHFSDVSSGANSDGANPADGLLVSGPYLFGTASAGGTGGNGAVFRYNINTKAFTVLHAFAPDNTNAFGVFTNGDGANPNSRLLLVGLQLYGSTSAGGTNGLGTLFTVGTNGLGFTVLHYFDTNGANPDSDLVFAGGTLFGIGGKAIFSLSTNGSSFTVLRRFDALVDGAPFATSGLTVSNATLYGVTTVNGNFGYGQIFAITTNGSGYADFHDFTPPVIYPPPSTNSDGTYPNGGLVLFNSALFGAASSGGLYGNGTLFSVTPNTVLSTWLSSTNLFLSFQTFAGVSCSIQQNTNLLGTNWVTITNFIGSGVVTQFTLPPTNKSPVFFRLN